MGLSRRPKQEAGQLAIYQLLLEIAQSLSVLSSDPTALQRTAKDAYELEDEEQKKATEAKEAIVKNEFILSEQKKQKIELDNLILDLNVKKDSIQSSLDSIAKERARLSKVDADYGARALELHNKEVDIKDREAKIIAAQDNLSRQTKALEEKQTELNEFEKSLKDKAEKLRSIVDE